MVVDVVAALLSGGRGQGSGRRPSLLRARSSAVTAATGMYGTHTHHMTADHMTGGGSGLAPVYGGPSTTGVVPVYSVHYTGVVPVLMVYYTGLVPMQLVPVHWCTLLVGSQCY